MEHMENGEQFVLGDEERLGDVELMRDDEIPLVDLQAEHEEVIAAVRKACEEWGFFQVINHGVPESLLQGLLEVSHQFFSLSLEERESVAKLGESLRALGNGDPVGVMRYGLSFKPELEKVPDLKYFLSFQCRRAEELNVWPPTPASMKDVLIPYNKLVRGLLEKLMRIIAEGLELPEELLLKCFGAVPRQILLLNYYPTHKDPSKVKGVSEHSDPSGITALFQDSVGGLEVHNNGKWVAVKPIKNAFVINLADQVQILSNGKYKSAEHRVRVNSEQPRVSAATFYGPSLDTLVAPVPELVDRDGGAKYREIVAKDYLAQFFKRRLSGKAALECVTI